MKIILIFLLRARFWLNLNPSSQWPPSRTAQVLISRITLNISEGTWAERGSSNSADTRVKGPAPALFFFFSNLSAVRDVPPMAAARVWWRMPHFRQLLRQSLGFRAGASITFEDVEENQGAADKPEKIKRRNILSTTSRVMFGKYIYIDR